MPSPSLSLPRARRAPLGSGLALLLGIVALAAEPSAGRAVLDITPRRATVGDRLSATLTIDVPAGALIEQPALGSGLGKLAVHSGSWKGPETVDGSSRWTWTGTLSAFETGDLEVPAIEIRVAGAGGVSTLKTEAVVVTIESVLPAGPSTGAKSEAPDLADLKPPASVPPDYGPLKKAALVLGLLLAAAGAAWWIHRWSAAKLARVPVPEDPFHRTPPHLWAYEQLQRLMASRLAEEGRFDEFCEELARILKRYLGGRYRMDLLERTTEEIPGLLREAGAGAAALLDVRSLLEFCDLVKFARRAASAEAGRKAVEDAYRIVDSTKPAEDGVSARESGGT